MDTPIPVKPTEKEKLSEPKRDDLQKRVDAVNAKIEAAKLKKKATVASILNKDKTTVVAAKEQADPLHVQLKELNELLKVQRPINEEAQAQLKVKQDAVDAIKKREADLSSKMKEVLPENVIRERLDELTYKQQNEKMTSQ